MIMYMSMLWPHDVKCSPYGRMKCKVAMLGGLTLSDGDADMNGGINGQNMSYKTLNTSRIGDRGMAHKCFSEPHRSHREGDVGRV